MTDKFAGKHGWYAKLKVPRTRTLLTHSVEASRPDLPIREPRKLYRNPLVVAMELHDELVRDNLTRRQLAERHGITSDRVTQWLCLLKLPDHEKTRLLALGDNWDRQVVTERWLRTLRKSHE